MIGTRVTGHLWQVTYSTEKQPTPETALVITADPTGAGLYERTREAIEQRGPGYHVGLKLELCRRIESVSGRAIVRTELMS